MTPYEEETEALRAIYKSAENNCDKWRFTDGWCGNGRKLNGSLYEYDDYCVRCRTLYDSLVYYRKTVERAVLATQPCEYSYLGENDICYLCDFGEEKDASINDGLEPDSPFYIHYYRCICCEARIGNE